MRFSTLMSSEGVVSANVATEERLTGTRRRAASQTTDRAGAFVDLMDSMDQQSSQSTWSITNG